MLESILENIGVGIAGLGILGFIGTLFDERPNDGVIGICIFMIALGWFIANLGSYDHLHQLSGVLRDRMLFLDLAEAY